MQNTSVLNSTQEISIIELPDSQQRAENSRKCSGLKSPVHSSLRRQMQIHTGAAMTRNTKEVFPGDNKKVMDLGESSFFNAQLCLLK